MKNECSIVKDLLPLYHDKVCSDDSKAFIEEHIKNCDNCKAYSNDLKETLDIEYQPSNDEINSVASFKKLKWKLIKRNILIFLVSIVVVISVLWLNYRNEIPIEYKEGLFDISQTEDGIITFAFEESDYHCAYNYSKTIVKDGEDINVEFVSFTDTTWTKYFTNGIPKEPSQFSIGQSCFFEENGVVEEIPSDIDYVYYLKNLNLYFDDRSLVKLTDDELVELIEENGIVIWEKESGQ